MIRQGWHFVPLCFLILLSACGQQKEQAGPTRWNSFPVSIYAESSIASSAQTQTDFNDAMNFWEAHAGRKLFSYQGIWSGSTNPYVGNPSSPSSILGNVIFFQSAWPFAANIAGQTVVLSDKGAITNSMVMINPNISYCSGNCTGQLGATSARKTFTHELGHFLGLSHVQEINNIMYPTIQAGGSLDSVTIDSATFAQLTQ